MTIPALNTAASGMGYQQRTIDVIANNLANLTTTAFKSQRLNGQDRPYLTLQQMGDVSRGGNPAPLQVGLGVRGVNTTRSFIQGPLDQTDLPLDIAIEGQGYFELLTPDTIGNGIAYTRDGSFSLDETGRIVTADGFILQPQIDIPDDSLSITIQPDGRVFVTQPGGVNTELGQILLTQFVNQQGLRALGQNLFIETDASGAPIGPTAPQTDGFGQLRQGTLESSNVDPVIEIVNLIKAQKAFEFNSKIIQAADEALTTIALLSR